MSSPLAPQLAVRRRGPRPGMPDTEEEGGAGAFLHQAHRSRRPGQREEWRATERTRMGGLEEEEDKVTRGPLTCERKGSRRCPLPALSLPLGDVSSSGGVREAGKRRGGSKSGDLLRTPMSQDHMIDRHGRCTFYISILLTMKCVGLNAFWIKPFLIIYHFSS